MALPIRPQQGLPKTPPVSPINDEPLPSLPSKAQEKASSTAPPAPGKQSPADEGWRVDPKTGKRYKQLPGYKPGVMESKRAIANVAKGNVSITQIRAMVDEEQDFNLDDLNGSADTFLSHLRVPPDKEEMKRLLAERAERQKIFDAAAAREAAEEQAALDQE